jgi:hypothetical protein
VSQVRQVEEELAQDLRERERRWRYRVRRGRVWFDKEVQQAHRKLRQSIPSFVWNSSPLNMLTAPLIYSLAIPLVLLDLWVTLYQWTCMPIYGVARVPRRAYFVIDRQKLGYLNTIEKAHCFYCSYATGLIAYVREVTARTEQYWCPIKHARPLLQPHAHYQQFLDYGDAEGYRHELPVLRRRLRHDRHGRQPE